MGTVSLSWSYRGSQTWQACRRQWFYQYASKGEPFQRKVELLKELATPEMVTGNIVEKEIQRCLYDLRDGASEAIDPDERIAEGVGELRRLLQESPAIVAAMRRNYSPEHGVEVPFFDDFFGTPHEESRLARCEQRTASAISNWYSGERRTRCPGVRRRSFRYRL
jgi:hypothetical protein